MSPRKSKGLIGLLVDLCNSGGTPEYKKRQNRHKRHKYPVHRSAARTSSRYVLGEKTAKWYERAEKRKK